MVRCRLYAGRARWIPAASVRTTGCPQPGAGVHRRWIRRRAPPLRPHAHRVPEQAPAIPASRTGTTRPVVWARRFLRAAVVCAAVVVTVLATVPPEGRAVADPGRVATRVPPGPAGPPRWRPRKGLGGSQRPAVLGPRVEPAPPSGTAAPSGAAPQAGPAPPPGLRRIGVTAASGGTAGGAGADPRSARGRARSAPVHPGRAGGRRVRTTPGRCSPHRTWRPRSGARRSASGGATAGPTCSGARARPYSRRGRARWCSPGASPDARSSRSTIRTGCGRPTSRSSRRSGSGTGSSWATRSACWSPGTPAAPARPVCTGACAAGRSTTSTRSSSSARRACACCRWTARGAT